MSFVDSKKYNVNIRKHLRQTKPSHTVDGKTHQQWAEHFGVSGYTIRRIVNRYREQNMTMLEMWKDYQTVKQNDYNFGNPNWEKTAQRWNGLTRLQWAKVLGVEKVNISYHLGKWGTLERYKVYQQYMKGKQA